MTNAALEKELIELERQYWQAIKDRDSTVVAQLTDEPCVVTGAQGVGAIDRAAVVKMMKEATYDLRSFVLTSPVVRLLSEDVAVLAYKVHEDLTVDGQALSFDAADSSTWVRREGHWVCAVHTEALAGDPFGRDRRAARAQA
jgi:hypothetical protein